MADRTSSSATAANLVVAGRPQRLQSLDVFRGLTLAAMILVNNPGSHGDAYRVLRHANWNGCRPADVIFPFFLFVVGAAIELALAGRIKVKASWPGLLWRIFRRTVMLAALGILLNGFPSFDWSEIRVPGVLQRIALCYALTAVLVISLSLRSQVLAAPLLLLLYAVLMLMVPVPGFGSGILRPGKDLGAYVDRILLGAHHLLFHRWDPEGLLGTLPAVATTLGSGVLATAWLRSGDRRFRDFIAVGTPLVAGALVLHRWFPINKNLWSPSFVLLTSGFAVVFLGVCHAAVDKHGVRRWSRPWAALGANPIAIYVLSTLCDKLMLLWTTTSAAANTTVTAKEVVFDRLVAHVGSPSSASLIYAVAYLLIWIGFAEWLYRRGVFIRL